MNIIFKLNFNFNSRGKLILSLFFIYFLLKMVFFYKSRYLLLNNKSKNIN